MAGSIMKHRHPGPYLIGARAHARVHKFSILEKRTGHVLKPFLVRSVRHDMPTLLYLVMLLNCYNRLQPWAVSCVSKARIYLSREIKHLKGWRDDSGFTNAAV